MNKRIISFLGIMIIIIFSLTGCDLEKKIVTYNSTNNEEIESVLRTTKDINLRDLDGNKTNYIFTYNNENFSAKYTKDNWHIEDSYKITNAKDIGLICQALIDVHPIHGKDMKSYRTVDDLVYEWQQHNLAYTILPDDNSWKEHAKDVDLNPDDQGKSLEEMYEDRTGNELDIEKLKNSQKLQRVKNSSKVQKMKNMVKGFLNN